MQTAQERAEKIVRLFPLVRGLALYVRGIAPGSDLDELIGDGTVGLIRAVDTFDSRRGVPLERYVRKIVVGWMLNGLRKRDPVSERARRTLRTADREMSEFAAIHGRLPSNAELESRCRGFMRARQAVQTHTPLSLDAPLPPGTRMLTVAEDPAERVAQTTEKEELAGAVSHLPERERRLITLHYQSEMPLRRIGACMSISPQRASQLHRSALGRLRKTLKP